MSEAPIALANNTCATTINISFIIANDTDYYQGLLFDINYYWWDVATVLCFTTVIFGALSWTLLPKWRQFRNYVFINASLASGTYLILNSGYIDTDTFLNYIADVCDNALPCWLVLIAYSFYMNVVKIFSHHPDHVYLYANAFGWAVPALFCACDILLDNDDSEEEYNDGFLVIEYTEIVSSIINLIMYSRVLYVLKASGNIRSSSKVSSWQRLRIATVIFVTSGVAIYIPLLILDRIDLKPELYSLPTFVYLIQLCLMEVMFLMLKCHWVLWKEFLYKQSLRNNSTRTVTDIRNDTYIEQEVTLTYLSTKDLPV